MSHIYIYIISESTTYYQRTINDRSTERQTYHRGGTRASGVELCHMLFFVLPLLCILSSTGGNCVFSGHSMDTMCII